MTPRKRWRIFAAYFITMALSAFLAYLLGHLLLRLPDNYVYTLVGLILFAVTVGSLIGIRIVSKKQE